MDLRYGCGLCPYEKRAYHTGGLDIGGGRDTMERCKETY